MPRQCGKAAFLGGNEVACLRSQLNTKAMTVEYGKVARGKAFSDDGKEWIYVRWMSGDAEDARTETCEEGLYHLQPVKIRKEVKVGSKNPNIFETFHSLSFLYSFAWRILIVPFLLSPRWRSRTFSTLLAPKTLKFFPCKNVLTWVEGNRRRRKLFGAEDSAVVDEKNNKK